MVGVEGLLHFYAMHFRRLGDTAGEPSLRAALRFSGSFLVPCRRSVRPEPMSEVITAHLHSLPCDPCGGVRAIRGKGAYRRFASGILTTGLQRSQVRLTRIIVVGTRIHEVMHA
jgi:hypothetical protein